MNTKVVTPPVPMDIVLIEDLEEQVTMVQEAFEECRLENRMWILKNPVEALVHLRQAVDESQRNENAVHRPGLILLDVDMREKRGFDLLHDLRTDPQLMTIPIVILTDSLEKSDLNCSMAHGVTGYFLKPMASGQLKKVIRDVEEHWAVLAQAPCAN